MTRGRAWALALCCFVSLCPVEVIAADWAVDPGIGTISALVETFAAPGDTLTLRDGVFLDNVALPDGDWTIRAANPGGAIIDGSGADSAAVVMSGNLFLRGLEVRGGKGHVVLEILGTKGGGGVCILGQHVLSSLDAKDCVFRDNEVRGDLDWHGGAVLADVIQSLRLEKCVFEDNYASGLGSAVKVNGPTDVEITECEFRDSDSAPEQSVFHGAPSGVQRIRDCEFFGPGAYAFPGGDTVVRNCDFVGAMLSFSDNLSSPGGRIECSENMLVGVNGGAVASLVSNSVLQLRGNTFVRQDFSISTRAVGGVTFDSNIVFESEGYVASALSGVLSCSVFWPKLLDDPFENLIVDSTVVVADPLFCDDVEWKLSDESPCLPENSPSGCDEVIGTNGACSEVPTLRRSWGDLKELFRTGR